MKRKLIRMNMKRELKESGVSSGRLKRVARNLFSKVALAFDAASLARDSRGSAYIKARPARRKSI